MTLKEVCNLKPFDLAKFHFLIQQATPSEWEEFFKRLRFSLTTQLSAGTSEKTMQELQQKLVGLSVVELTFKEFYEHQT